MGNASARSLKCYRFLSAACSTTAWPTGWLLEFGRLWGRIGQAMGRATNVCILVPSLWLNGLLLLSPLCAQPSNIVRALFYSFVYPSFACYT
ncbi:unnamed protein product [Toxocara canis]|uniref:Secreted protein n=1 Tax=Toxocara canis TaxID=6265 RepID=A0A183V5T1_TOXCA|nr:unnamed protein product [Toxocara canis]